MSMNQEVFRIGNVECYPSEFAPREVQQRFTLCDNGPHLLTADQQNQFEQSIQATVNGKVGEAALIQVPILVPPDQIPHPIQVKRLPWRETDLLPQNRAIAEIGEALTYWQSVNEIIHDPYSKIGFFELKNVTLHPLYITPDSRQFVFTVPIPKYDVLSYGKSIYESRIQFINHAGDGAFCGTWGSPLASVSFRSIDHTEGHVPYSDLGVSENTVKSVFESARTVWDTREWELGQIFQLIHEACPTRLWPLIVPLIERNGGLQAHHIVNENYKHHYLEDVELFDELSKLEQQVNRAFLERISSSKTALVVDEYQQILGRMYQEALLSYKFSL